MRPTDDVAVGYWHRQSPHPVQNPAFLAALVMALMRWVDGLVTQAASLARWATALCRRLQRCDRPVRVAA